MPAASGPGSPSSLPLAGLPSGSPPADAVVEPGLRLPVLLAVLATILLLAGAAPLFGAIYLSHKHAGQTLPGLRIDGQPLGGVPFSALPVRVHQVIEQFLSRKVYLRVGGERVPSTWRELGVLIDEADLVADARVKTPEDQIGRAHV